MFAAKILLTAAVALLRFHSIHLSFAKAEVEVSRVHLKVSYYKDDYLRAVNSWFSGKTAPSGPAELEREEEEYFKEYLRLWSGSNFTHLLAINNYHVEDDGTSLIFEANYESDIPISQLSIDHRALCKEFGDQMNILSIRIFGSDRNLISTGSKPTATLTKS